MLNRLSKILTCLVAVIAFIGVVTDTSNASQPGRLRDITFAL